MELLGKTEPRETFLGRTYRYNTPNHGTRTIGVCLGLGSDIYIVAYLRDNGARVRVKTPRLPVLADAAALQKHLDAWAAERGLEEASCSEKSNN
jgi:hypothetical protein